MATYVPGSYTLEVTATDPSPSAQKGTDTGSLTVHPTGVDILPAYDYYQFQNGLSVALGIGTAYDVNTALPFEGLDVFLEFDPALDTVTAHTMTIRQSLEFQPAIETDTANTLSYAIYLSVGTAYETATAGSISTIALISNLSMTVVDIPDGVYKVRLLNDSDTLVYVEDVTFSGGSGTA